MEILLISSESDASCSFGSSEEDVEVEEECEDMEDDSDEDEGSIIFFVQKLPFNLQSPYHGWIFVPKLL